MSGKCVYIEAKLLKGNEVVVRGTTSSGEYIFVFRAPYDPFNSWKDAARNFTPTGCTPVFREFEPPVMRDGRQVVFRARSC